jgi:hypothetical protein
MICAARCDALMNAFLSKLGFSIHGCLTDKNLLFAAPLVLDAARVRENWFLVSLIMAA